MSPFSFASNQQYLAWECDFSRRRILQVLQMSATGAPLRFDPLHERHAARRAREQALDLGVDIYLAHLCHAWALNDPQEEALSLAASLELSQAAHRAFIDLQGDRYKNHFELGPLVHALGGHGAPSNEAPYLEAVLDLVDRGLLAKHPTAIEPSGDWRARGLHVPLFLVDALRGRASLDPSLRAFATLRWPREAPRAAFLECKQCPHLIPFLERHGVEAELHTPARPLLLLRGPCGVGKSTLIKMAADHLAAPIISVQCSLVEPNDANARRILTLFANAHFLGAWVHLEHPERTPRAQHFWPRALSLALARPSALCIIEEGLAGDQPPLDLPGLDLHEQRVATLEAEDRCHIWQAHGGPLGLSPRDVERLAAHFTINGHQIANALRCSQQRAQVAPTTPLDADSVSRVTLSLLQRKANKLSEARRVALTLEDIVLPPKTREQVLELLSACRQRAQVMSEWGLGQRLVTGKGLVALFAGESGTGKTLCAEILANEIGQRLHRVSVPDIISKYVGEAEKNLQELFRYARAHQAMLLFDEADALFGKRVKVERAQDHYQNMEVNMLLQEVERFEGIMLLTTNLEANMDRAFERRVLFRIDFPSPDAAQRAVIWERLIPPATPIAGRIDFRHLGERFEATGGEIKNAIVRAAYGCAARGESLSQAALEQAARRQARAAGKLSRADEDAYTSL